MNNKEQIDRLILDSKKILITGHIGPDDDSVASILAMKWYLNKYFNDKEVIMAISGKKEPKWEYLEGVENIVWTPDIQNILTNVDLLILLDGTPLERFSEEHTKINLKDIKTLCIDHHVYGKDDYTLTVRDVSACANTQIITEILFTQQDLKDKGLGEILLIGIYGDTGGMTFIGPDSTRVYSTVQKIVENSKVNIQTLLNKKDSMSEKKFEFIKILMHNTTNVEISPQLPKLTYSYYPDDLWVERNNTIMTGAKKKYSRIVIRKIQNHPWGFVVTPQDGEFSISFRASPGSPDVQKISSKYFTGGGHPLAAGGQLPKGENESVKDFIEKVLKILRENEIELTSLDQ